MIFNRTMRKIGLQYFAESGDGGASGEGTAGAESGASSGGAAEKTFTQADVNTLMANEKRSARAALLKELGYEVKDGDYKKTVGDIKTILDQGKTQQQLDKEAKTQAAERATTAEGKVANLQAQVDVMRAGVKPDYVEDAITMLLPKATQEKPLTKLLEEYKTKYPVWFGESSAGSAGTGGSTNPPRGKGGNSDGLGKRLAQTTKGAPAKSSYFKT